MMTERRDTIGPLITILHKERQGANLVHVMGCGHQLAVTYGVYYGKRRRCYACRHDDQRRQEIAKLRDGGLRWIETLLPENGAENERKHWRLWDALTALAREARLLEEEANGMSCRTCT